MSEEIADFLTRLRALVSGRRRGMTDKLDQEARVSLLRYYSDKCTSHATNVLAIAIGFFAYVQIVHRIFESFSHIPSILLNSFFLSGFSALGLHQFVRLLVWAKFTRIPVWADPKKVEKRLTHKKALGKKLTTDERDFLKREDTSFLEDLEWACRIEFGRLNKWPTRFKDHMRFIVPVVFVGLTLAFFLIQFLWF